MEEVALRHKKGRNSLPTHDPQTVAPPQPCPQRQGYGRTQRNHSYPPPPQLAHSTSTSSATRPNQVSIAPRQPLTSSTPSSAPLTKPSSSSSATSIATTAATSKGGGAMTSLPVRSRSFDGRSPSADPEDRPPPLPKRAPSFPGSRPVKAGGPVPATRPPRPSSDGSLDPAQPAGCGEGQGRAGTTGVTKPPVPVKTCGAGGGHSQPPASAAAQSCHLSHQRLLIAAVEASAKGTDCHEAGAGESRKTTASSDTMAPEPAAGPPRPPHSSIPRLPPKPAHVSHSATGYPLSTVVPAPKPPTRPKPGFKPPHAQSFSEKPSVVQPKPCLRSVQSAEDRPGSQHHKPRSASSPTSKNPPRDWEQSHSAAKTASRAPEFAASRDHNKSFDFHHLPSDSTGLQRASPDLLKRVKSSPASHATTASTSSSNDRDKSVYDYPPPAEPSGLQRASPDLLKRLKSSPAPQSSSTKGQSSPDDPEKSPYDYPPCEPSGLQRASPDLLKKFKSAPAASESADPERAAYDYPPPPEPSGLQRASPDLLKKFKPTSTGDGGNTASSAAGGGQRRPQHHRHKSFDGCLSSTVAPPPPAPPSSPASSAHSLRQQQSQDGDAVFTSDVRPPGDSGGRRHNVVISSTTTFQHGRLALGRPVPPDITTISPSPPSTPSVELRSPPPVVAEGAATIPLQKSFKGRKSLSPSLLRRALSPSLRRRKVKDSGGKRSQGQGEGGGGGGVEGGTTPPGDPDNCQVCGFPLGQEFMSVQGVHYHKACFRCNVVSAV